MFFVNQVGKYENMASNLTEQQLANISMTPAFDLDVENATWISANCSLSNSPVGDSTKRGAFGTYYNSVSRYVIASLYWLIFVVGIAGNLLVVAVVIWKPVSYTHLTLPTILRV